MGHGPSLIEQDRPTIASVLHSAGYRTGAVGKWHLGLGWRHRDGSVWDARNPEDPMEYQLGDPLARHDSVDLDAGSTVDYSQPFTGGPLQLGFDRFFGIAGSLNMPPYAYLEQDRTRGVPTAMKSDFLPGQRPGYQAADWDEHEVDLTFVARAKEFIADESPEPFFLYFAPSAPHRPQVSPPRFRGTSGAGSRGDSVVFVDWMVGELVDALRDRGVLDDTIIVFTSDNGSPTIFADELDPAHRPNGPWRGQKGDTWEGGHREPLIVRWPHAVPAGTVSDEPVDLVDLMRSISVLVDITLPTDAAPDSRDRSRALRAVPGSESSSLRVISSREEHLPRSSIRGKSCSPRDPAAASPARVTQGRNPASYTTSATTLRRPSISGPDAPTSSTGSAVESVTWSGRTCPSVPITFPNQTIRTRLPRTL